jgi:hypothetical protein
MIHKKPEGKNLVTLFLYVSTNQLIAGWGARGEDLKPLATAHLLYDKIFNGPRHRLVPSANYIVI